ncbi:hypothetical protein CEXT_197811 [Caerostris extrusa]|uniref:Uncharacterized protein n=1 Tax=Caerostris extrusa TaxID=172846 RepID=A0AAV4XVM5_CAEEX|nr:hypothetical protein CEXT_197811 [Caerostris extrusa]
MRNISAQVTFAETLIKRLFAKFCTGIFKRSTINELIKCFARECIPNVHFDVGKLIAAYVRELEVQFQEICIPNHPRKRMVISASYPRLFCKFNKLRNGHYLC